LVCSPTIIQVINKEGEMVGHMACTGGNRNTYRTGLQFSRAMQLTV